MTRETYYEPQAFGSLKIIDDGDVINKTTLHKKDVQLVKENQDGTAMIKISKELREFLEYKFLR